MLFNLIIIFIFNNIYFNTHNKYTVAKKCETYQSGHVKEERDIGSLKMFSSSLNGFFFIWEVCVFNQLYAYICRVTLQFNKGLILLRF